MSSYVIDKTAVIALSENKVFIAYSYSEDNSSIFKYLRAAVYTIDETTITYNTSAKISVSATNTITISLTKLSNNTVFIACNGQGSNSGTYSMLFCTINSTSITSSSIVTMKANNTASNIIPIQLSENKIFVVFSDANDYRLSSMICTINENAITLGEEVLLSTKSKSGFTIEAIKISENKIFIFHANNDNSRIMYGMLCTINKDTITVDADMQLKIFNITYTLHVSIVQLSENKIFIYYNNINEGINALMCIINNNVIETAKDIQVVDNNLEESYQTLRYALAVLINNNEMFVVHNSSNNFILQAIICTDEIYTEVNLLEKRADDIYGVAKTSGEEGDTIDVYRPKEVAV